MKITSLVTVTLLYLLEFGVTIVKAKLLLDAIQQTTQLSKLNGIINNSSILHNLYQNADNFTFLAPSNAAIELYLSQNAQSSTQNEDLVAALEYHLLHGQTSFIEFTSVPQYNPTWLTNESYSNVTGGQRVITTKANESVQIESGNETISTIITSVR